MPLAKSLQGRTYKKRPKTMFYQKKKQPTVKSLNSQVKALRKSDYSIVPMNIIGRLPLFDAETLVANTPVFDDITAVNSTIFAQIPDGDRLLKAKFNVQLQNVAAGSETCHFRLVIIRDNRGDDAETVSYSGGAAPIFTEATPFATYYAVDDMPSGVTTALDNLVYPTYLGVRRDDSRLTNEGNSYRIEVLYDKRVTLSDSGFGEDKDWEFELDLYGVKQDLPNRYYKVLAICDQAVILDMQCVYTVLHKIGNNMIG